MKREIVPGLWNVDRGDGSLTMVKASDAGEAALIAMDQKGAEVAEIQTDGLHRTWARISVGKLTYRIRVRQVWAWVAD
jgi:hypothetical protein